MHNVAIKVCNICYYILYLRIISLILRDEHNFYIKLTIIFFYLFILSSYFCLF